HPGHSGSAPDGCGGPPDRERAGTGGSRRGSAPSTARGDTGAALGGADLSRHVRRAARGDGGLRARPGPAARGAGHRAATPHARGPEGRMSAPVTDIDLRELARSRPVHFMGVTGAGMSALAELLLRSGGRVTGCDARPGPAAAALAARGLEVAAGHDPAHVEDAAAVVVTAAVPPDHPELATARARGIPVVKRAQALGAVVNSGIVVAVAGTHGKTTTTAMVTAILAEAGLDPTGFVGGRVRAWDGGLRPGSDRLFVVEADEYDRSFLALRPRIAVVTTVEADHLDIYGSVDAIEEAFREFLAPVPEDGLIAACVDDDGARRVLRAAGHAPTLGYGLSAEAELRATSIEQHGRGSRFRVEEG